MLFMLLGHVRRGARGNGLQLGERRAAPSGLRYVGSWVEANLGRCFQAVECDDPRTLQQWAARWRHLVELEVVPVVPADETVATLTPLLG